MSDQQETLFPKDALPAAEDEQKSRLNKESSLHAALEEFKDHMRDEGFAINTVKAFASDVRLLGKYLGMDHAIGEIGTKDLNDFLNWMLYERGVSCKPKTYARRVTTLKVFFSWLHEDGVLPDDPAAAVIQQTVRTPLPTIPDEEDLEKALQVTSTIRTAEKPDARPHLLLTLLLQTGIKKGEAMTLELKHIDRSTPQDPVLFIRYANPRLRYKERKVYPEPEWLDVLDEYLQQYQPDDTLFTCTARNLEYVLTDVGEEAGIERGRLSFENLRWAAALRDFRADVEQDEIRQKLGLSKITWRETKRKLEQLLAQQQEDGDETEA